MSKRAITILNQLTQSNNGANRINIMLGLKGKIIVSDTDKKVSVAFKFKAKGLKKINSLYIELNSMDLYDVTFQRVYNKKDKVLNIMMPQVDEIETINNVYFEDLKSIFENKTGLYLSL